MAVTSAQFTITDAAVVALNTPQNGGIRMVVMNHDNSDDLYLGGSAVTAGTGLILGNGETVTVELEPDEVLYGISVPAGVLVSVLRS